MLKKKHGIAQFQFINSPSLPLNVDQPYIAKQGAVQGCTAHQWGRQDVEPQTEVKRRENLRQSIGDKGDTLARRDKNKRHIHISTTLSLAESPRRVGERKNERRPNRG